MADASQVTEKIRSPWSDIVANDDPTLIDKLNTLRTFAVKEGALPTRLKVLMLLLCSSLLYIDKGVPGLGELARKSGASEEEIKETLHVAMLMGGMSALVIGPGALTKQ